MFPDPFGSRPEEYDAWYDENLQTFLKELELVKDWVRGFPSLELGVGTGRFASGLGIGFGLDRAVGALRLARQRGVRTIAGDARTLPFGASSFALVGIFFTLEFLPDPAASFDECYRILVPTGRLLILHILPSSFVAEKKGRGFYASMVRLYYPEEILGLARGFRLTDQRERDDLSALLFEKT